MKTINLPNGLKVVYEQSKASKVTSIQIWVCCGSANEQKSENGVSHFIEHILFKGTKNHKLGGVADSIETLGGELNAFTSKDHTCYYATVPTLYYKDAMNVLKDLVFYPLMDDKDIEDEREVILEEIRRYQDIPSSVASDMFYELHFKDHSYGMPIQGYDYIIKDLEIPKIKKYYSKFYTTSNAIVVLCGDVDEDDAFKSMTEIFGGINTEKNLAPPINHASFISKSEGKIFELDVKEAVLYFGFSIPGLMDKDVPALDLLSNVLGQSESSRLVKKLRVEKGLVTSISTSSYTPKYAGSFAFGFSFDGESSKIKSNIAIILKELFSILKEFGTNGVEAGELIRAKNITLSEKVYERRTVDGMASRLGRLISITGGTEFEDKYIEAIKKVSVKDVLDVFNKYIISPYISVSAAVPKGSNISSDDLISMFEKEIEKLSTNKTKTKKLVSTQQTMLDIDVLTEPVNMEPVLVSGERGSKIILKKFGSVPLCSMYICFPGGVSFENEQTNGISNLASRTLVYGAGNLNYDQITAKVDGTASFFDVFSGRDGFGVSLTVLKPYFKEILEIVKTVLSDPRFEEKYFNIEKKIVEDEIRSAQDNLSSYTHSLFLKTMYQKSQYRLEAIGSLESVKNISSTDVNNFYNGILNPEKMVISFAGDFEKDQAVDWSKNLISSIGTRKNISQNVIEEPEQKTQRSFNFKKDTKQAHLMFGYRTCNILDDDVSALKVLAGVLLGQSGRLFINLRDKQSLAYSVFPTQMFAKRSGYFAVYIATEHAKVEKAILEIRKELEKLKQEFVTEEELRRAKNYLIGLKEIELQTSCAQSLNMGLYEFYGHGFKKAFNYSENIMKISKDDVQKVARKYFMDNKENLVILTK